MPTVYELSRQRVIDRMGELDLSQTDLARAIGVTPQTINKYIHGVNPIKDVAMLVRLAKALGVSVGFLVGESASVSDAKMRAVAAACQGLSDDALDLVLALAQRLGSGPPVAPTSDPSPGRRKSPTPSATPFRKLR